MRANLSGGRGPRPTSSPTGGHPTMELEGVYLRSMQEISARLMNNLPAGDDLWRVLGQAEALLLEAQLQGIHPDKVFNDGGVAGFCQSILDEFAAEGSTVGKGKSSHSPASKDPSTRRRARTNEPRGGINFKRKKIFTAVLAVVLALLCTLGILVYTGIWRYWTRGSGFYLEELYNFTNTTEPTGGAALSFTVPLEVKSGLSRVLYDDGLYTVTLTGLNYTTYAESFSNGGGGNVGQTVNSWSIRLEYTVLADFNTVSYVEPAAKGQVTVTLADGTSLEGTLAHLESGPTGDGVEYATITVAGIPASVSTAGATLTVSLDPPELVTWKRISTGKK